MLNEDTFLEVVRHAPLVSIDLIVESPEGRILLGHRLNAPARGFWFVPGGRIYKNETLAAALARISLIELGCEYALSTAVPLGCYEHFYQDNFSTTPDISTHYVVLAYQLTLNQLSDAQMTMLPDSQHDNYRWFERAEIIKNPAVHANTRAYFIATNL
jgi:colanic acid biosynthesis protein WcaH